VWEEEPVWRGNDVDEEQEAGERYEEDSEQDESELELLVPRQLEGAGHFAPWGLLGRDAAVDEHRSKREGERGRG
jgi:hypothetical protein